MKFDLAQQAARRRPSRRPIDLPPIITTKAQADDLAKVYLQMVQGWRMGSAAIVESYTKTLEQILTTDTVNETQAAMDVLGANIQRLLLLLTPDLKDWAIRTESWHRGKWARGVLSATDINLETLLGPTDVQETVEASIARNVSLVRDVSDEARRRIADSVFRGFQQRTPAHEVAKEITQATAKARRRSVRIAADQTVKLASALDAQRQRQVGLDHWKWRHSGKLHPRLQHKERDGKVYTDETAPKDLPGQLPFCGCVRQGVVVFEDD